MHQKALAPCIHRLADSLPASPLLAHLLAAVHLSISPQPAASPRLQNLDHSISPALSMESVRRKAQQWNSARDSTGLETRIIIPLHQSTSR